MATILKTETTFTFNDPDFILLIEYSGETNPNVTFTVTFNVKDENSQALESVLIQIDGTNYYTDLNGQFSIDLIRGDYLAEISLIGYLPNSINFTILDQNLVENITLIKIGSFDNSYDNSYEK